MSNNIDHIRLNNEVSIRDKDGNLQLHKDKEALDSYLKNVIEPKLAATLEDRESIGEHLDYLINNKLYTPEIYNLYDKEFIIDLLLKAKEYNFEFATFMAAQKFYTDYGLKSFNGEKYLETVEWANVRNILFGAQGDTELALKALDIMMTQSYQPATPTYTNSNLFRAGEKVSCFLLEVGDSMNDINHMISTASQLSKLGGGISINISKIRAAGEEIRGVSNAAKGLVGVMKTLDHTFRYADQMGQRQGAGAVYTLIYHADIIEFLNTKKIAGDEDVRVKTLSLGVTVPNIFWEQAERNEDISLFYPHSVYKKYGVYIDEIDMNEWYEKLHNDPDVRKKKINARALELEISKMRYESGYPFIMHLDNANDVHALNNVGKVKFSNLCSEILQVSKLSTIEDYDDSAKNDIGFDISCNLGSLNLLQTYNNKNLKESIEVAVRFLNAVVDDTDIRNAPGVKKANKLIRSIGLGVMNVHGLLANIGLNYDSNEGLDFMNVYMSIINYHSLRVSNELAIERGTTFYGFEGSKYHTGEYFTGHIKEVQPKFIKVKELLKDVYIPTQEDYDNLKESVMKHGLLNGYRLAIPPTGNISYFSNSTAGSMPITSRIETRATGKVNTLVPMPNLGPKTWWYYKEATDMTNYDILNMTAVLQRYIDQGISTTLFLTTEDTTRDLSKLDHYARAIGVKTTYYIRTKKVADATDISNGIGSVSVDEGCISCAL